MGLSWVISWVCLVPRPHYSAQRMCYGSRVNWPRRPGKTLYKDKSWVMPRVKSGGYKEKKVAVLDANLGEFLNGLLCWLEPPIHQINSIRCGISHVFCHKPAKTRQIGRCGRNSHHSTLRYTKPITTSMIANPFPKTKLHKNNLYRWANPTKKERMQ